MASVKYDFSITDDTADGIANLSTLISEINSSNIVTAIDLELTNIYGDELNLWFKDTLSSGDETILGTLVAAHTGIAITEIGDTELNWSSFKSLIDEIKPSLLYCEPPGSNKYHIYFAHFGALVHCDVTKGTSDATDFETNYKSNANQNEAPRVRITTNKIGRKMHIRYITFVTSDQDNFDNTDFKDDNYGDLTYIMKDIAGSTTTVNADAKETWLDWEPPYDYEISGGALYVPSTLDSRELSVSSLVQSEGVATGIVSAGHDLKVNTMVTMSGASPTEYNGIKKILAIPSSTEFTYAVSSSGVASPASGTITMTEGDDAWEIHVVAVPDVPAAYGGEIQFIANPRIKWIKNMPLTIDSSNNPAELKYSASLHSNKLRVIMKHPTGAQTEFQLKLILYKD